MLKKDEGFDNACSKVAPFANSTADIESTCIPARVFSPARDRLRLIT